MKTLLVRFGLWLAKLGGWVPPEPVEIIKTVEVPVDVVTYIEVPVEIEKEVVKGPVVPQQVLELATAGVIEQDTRWPERDGEGKRAAVYRTLLNAFPKESKRVLARAIEDAVCSAC